MRLLYRNYQKSAYLTMLYKKSIYYIDALQCLTLFEKFKKTGEIKKILKECKFLSCKDKNVMKELRKSGLPLTGNEFDMKNILSLHQKDEKFTDLMIE